MKPAELLDHTSPFRTLVRLVDLGVLIVSPDRTLEFISERARELLHGPPGNDRTTCWSQVRALVEPALDRTDTVRAATTPVTVQNRDAHGPRQLRLDVYLLPDAAETHAGGYLVLVQDYDTFQHVEQRLHVATQKHQAGRFYEALAHDLRQPIGAILIHLKVLEDLNGRSDLDEARTQTHFSDSLDTIRSEVLELDRSLRLLLRELAPMNAEGAVCLREVMQGVAHLIEPQIHKEGLVLRTTLPDESLLVRGPRFRIKQAVLALATHALETTPAGAITLRLSTRGERACIEVADEGPGLSKDAQARLFEHPSAIGEEHTNPGLYFVRQTTQSYGGDVEVQSTPGEGTTFALFLPLLTGDEA